MPVKILLADKSITIQKVVEMLFSGKEYSVTAVSDGESALGEASRVLPDVVLADVDLPRLDGYSFGSRLKQNPQLSRTPVILMLSRDDVYDEAKGRQAGIVDHIAKPFESQDLIGKVKKALAPAPQRPGEAAAAPRPPARPVPVRVPLWPDGRCRLGRPDGRAGNREVGRPGARCWGRRYLPYRPPAPSGPAQASPGRPALALPHTTKPGPAAGRPQAGSARKCARRRLRFRVGATRQVNRLRPPVRPSLTPIRPGPGRPDDRQADDLRSGRTTGRPDRRPGGTAYSTETP